MPAKEWVTVFSAAQRARSKRAAMDVTLAGRPVQLSARWLDEDARRALPLPHNLVTTWQLVGRVDLAACARLGQGTNEDELVGLLVDDVAHLQALWTPTEMLSAPLGGSRGQRLTLVLETWRAGLERAPCVVRSDRWLALHLALQRWTGMLVDATRTQEASP